MLAYPLSLQTVLPEDYAESGAFASLLSRLRALGFAGVELNIADPLRHDVRAVRSFLGSYGLKLTMLATGLTARQAGLSLSHPDEGVRRASIEASFRLIDWVAGADTGLIIGFLKGGVASDPRSAQELFARSLAELAPRAESAGVNLHVEATNRYESSVANTLDEAAAFVEGTGSPRTRLLPDTFHMNIEEADPYAALERNRARFASLHLSDNNRLLPGLGALDFTRMSVFLRNIGYAGGLALEGNIQNDIESDLRASMDALAPLLGA